MNIRSKRLLLNFLFGVSALSTLFSQSENLAPVLRQAGGQTDKIVKCYPGGLMRAYCISFDDGTLGSDWPVLDALRKRGIPATFFINSLHPQSKDAVNFPEQYQGFEIASHGANHKGLGTMSISDARKEIEQDQEILGNKFKCRIQGFAYPYGEMPKDAKRLAEFEGAMKELGIVYARPTGQTKAFAPPQDFLRWIPDCGFLYDLDHYLRLPADDSVRVMMSFAHSIDFARGRISFEKWIKQLDEVAADHTLWKQTMLAYACYIEALRSLEITDGGVINKASIPVWIRLNDKPLEIKAGSTSTWQELKSLP